MQATSWTHQLQFSHVSLAPPHLSLVLSQVSQGGEPTLSLPRKARVATSTRVLLPVAFSVAQSDDTAPTALLLSRERSQP